MDDFQLGEHVTRQMPGAPASAAQVRRALGLLYGAAKPTVDEAASKVSNAAGEAGRFVSGAASTVGADVSRAADAAVTAVRPHLPKMNTAEEERLVIGRGLLKAGNKIAPQLIPPLEDEEPQPAPSATPYWKTEEFQQKDAQDNPIRFPEAPQVAGPSPRELRPELMFPKATDQQNHPGWEADKEKAAAERRQQFNQKARENAEKNRLRFPDPPAPPQGADSMDRLMGRSAANGFPISEAPPRGFALPGHEPKNFSAADAIEGQAGDRAKTITAMAEEMGVGPENQFPSDIDRKIAAVRQAQGKPATPVDSELTMPRTIAYPPPPKALIDAGLAPSFPPTPDEIKAREERIIAAATPGEFKNGPNPGLGFGVLTPSASNRVATLARDARKQQESKSAEESAAKLKADATAQQEQVKAERQRVAAEKAEKDSAEEERLAVQTERTRRHAPMAGIGGVMISPAERMTADTNVSGRYSGPVGSRSAPMAMSPQDVKDVTGIEGSPAAAMDAKPDYGLLADKMGLPADMDPDERLEQAMVFWGDQISRSKNSDVKEAQGGGFYFAPSKEAKDRYKQAGLRADARSIKTTYPRNQSGTQDHIEALDQAVANNSPQEIGQIRRALYDDRNTATAAFIRDRGRMQQATRNMTDPRLAPAALAESLKAAQTPQEKADVYRQFGRADLADQIETRLSSEGEGERGRRSTERMHRLDDATKNAETQSRERVGLAGADASKANVQAQGAKDQKELDLKGREVAVKEKDQASEDAARSARADADERDREMKQWGPGDAQEAAATRVLAPILNAGDEETPRALAEVPAIVKKHYMNVKQMMQDEGIEGAEAYTLEQAGEELLAQANRGHDPVQHPVLRAWVKTEGGRLARMAKKSSGWSQSQTRQKQYEAFRDGMARIGINETSPLFKEVMNTNGIAAPAQAGR